MKRRGDKELEMRSELVLPRPVVIKFLPRDSDLPSYSGFKGERPRSPIEWEKEKGECSWR